MTTQTPQTTQASAPKGDEFDTSKPFNVENVSNRMRHAWVSTKHSTGLVSPGTVVAVPEDVRYLEEGKEKIVSPRRDLLAKFKAGELEGQFKITNKPPTDLRAFAEKHAKKKGKKPDASG